VDFKGKAKAFVRTYGFLASILPYTNADWEKLSIFLNFLIPKLPPPVDEDLSKGILETIDMDSYRVEKQTAIKIQLPDQNAEIEPVPTSGGGHKPEPELDRLSNILKAFNDLFGKIPWVDGDRVRKMITEEIPQRVAADAAYRNARQGSDKQNARIEHDKALARVVVGLMKDDTELFKQFSDNPEFRRWLSDTIFSITYAGESPQATLTGGVLVLGDSKPGFDIVPAAQADKFRRHLPVYSLQAAAGQFLYNRPAEDGELGWIEVPASLHPREDMFVVTVRGKSMEPRIGDGSYAVFRAPAEGSRDGRIVLVELTEPEDPEGGGRYTVKVWRSDKAATEPSEGGWRHDRIVLEPLNSAFKPIVLTGPEGARVIGDFVATL
jgi:SOS-response transcriptional repressor LexA